MDKSSTENNDALMPKTPTVDFETTTTLPLGVSPFNASIASGSVQNEFMDMDSSSKNQSFILRFGKDWFGADFSGSLPVRIVEKLGPGIYRVELMTSSNDGSTGPSPEEAEHCEP